MGTTNSTPRRYMGGKLPHRYFKEDMWPVCQDVFLKLNITEPRAVTMFKVFTNIDQDNESEMHGTLRQEECLAHFGGTKTKFTERLFYGNSSEGMDFQAWAIAIWNFCTLSTELIARLAFEIFDPDKIEKLELADIRTMYRMLYGVDEHDDRQIAAVPFIVDEEARLPDHDVVGIGIVKPSSPVAGGRNSNDDYSIVAQSSQRQSVAIQRLSKQLSKRLSFFNTPWASSSNLIADKHSGSRLTIRKDKFVAFCCSRRHLIQPIINYQRRLRLAIGGLAMWEILSGYRRKYFSPFDSTSPTLTDSLDAILKTEDVGIRHRLRLADKLLEDQKRKLEQSFAKAEEELDLHRLKMEKDRHKAEIVGEEENVINQSLARFYDAKFDFVHADFTMDTLWERRQARLALYDLLDSWNALSKAYFDAREKEELDMTVGNEEDQRYRYQDFVDTADGARILKIAVIHVALRPIVDAEDGGGSPIDDGSVSISETSAPRGSLSQLPGGSSLLWPRQQSFITFLNRRVSSIFISGAYPDNVSDSAASLKLGVSSSSSFLGAGAATVENKRRRPKAANLALTVAFKEVNTALQSYCDYGYELTEAGGSRANTPATDTIQAAKYFDDDDEAPLFLSSSAHVDKKTSTRASSASVLAGRWRHLKKVLANSFDREYSVMTQHLSADKIEAAKAEAGNWLLNKQMEKLALEAVAKYKESRTARERDYIRKDFELASSFGSRITRWEYVRDASVKTTSKYVYVNVDTLETLHRLTAICEKCDSAIEQHNLSCRFCDQPRSVTNLKLYRPLGARQLTTINN